MIRNLMNDFNHRSQRRQNPSHHRLLHRRQTGIADQLRLDRVHQKHPRSRLRQTLKSEGREERCEVVVRDDPSGQNRIGERLSLSRSHSTFWIGQDCSTFQSCPTSFVPGSAKGLFFFGRIFTLCLKFQPAGQKLCCSRHALNYIPHYDDHTRPFRFRKLRHCLYDPFVNLPCVWLSQSND
jgi:hypothetical protein